AAVEKSVAHADASDKLGQGQTLCFAELCEDLFAKRRRQSSLARHVNRHADCYADAGCYEQYCVKVHFMRLTTHAMRVAIQHSHFVLFNSSRAAAESARMPVFSVGSGGGAKSEECREGKSAPLDFACSYFAGSTPPTQKMSPGILSL